MKRLQRPPAPPRFDRTNASQRAEIRAWYAGKPDDHWNYKVGGKCPARDSLQAMSAGCCAWCERRLEKTWHVEHYLPRKEFPWLQYCWENLLPSCSDCNHAKRTVRVTARTSGTWIDPVLVGHQEGEPYEPVTALATIEDRLIEPSVDDPDVHLRFQPADCTWHDRSPVGYRTIEKLFSDRSYNERIQGISDLARDRAFGTASEELARTMLGLLGHETLYATLLAYWRSFTPAARA